MTQPTPPSHLQQTVEEFNRRLERNAEERQDLLTGLEVILKLINEHYELPGLPRTDELADCPLSLREMTQLKDRHLIIRTIAERDPEGRVHAGKAARWLNAAGIVATNPVNLAKALSRRMRKDPETWIYEGAYWFRLASHQGEDEHPSEGITSPDI